MSPRDAPERRGAVPVAGSVQGSHARRSSSALARCGRRPQTARKGFPLGDRVVAEILAIAGPAVVAWGQRNAAWLLAPPAALLLIVLVGTPAPRRPAERSTLPWSRPDPRLLPRASASAASAPTGVSPTARQSCSTPSPETRRSASGSPPRQPPRCMHAAARADRDAARLVRFRAKSA